VHVFHAGGAGWTHVAALSAPQPAEDQGFGAALALRGDVALISAPGANDNAGAVHIFRRSRGTWSAGGTLPSQGVEESDRFGIGLALGDGFAVVGAPFADQQRGTVYRYRLSEDGDWLQVGTFLPFSGDRRDRFGWALDIDGGAVFVGAPGAREGRGVAYRFWRTGDVWTGSAVLGSVDAEARANLGSNLDVNGDLAAASMLGADYGAGTVAIFERVAGDAWEQRAVVLSKAETYAAVTGGRVECGPDGVATAFTCSNVDLQAFLPVSAIGGSRGVRLNDIWGWTDPETGREYALVGRIDGASFVDVTNAQNPVYIGSLPRTDGSPPSVWRDIKVYENHAFIVADAADDHGVQIFDLTRLRDVRPADMPVTFDEDAHYDGIASAHNIVIDTASGFAFTVGNSSGGETCGGGLHIIDIRQPTEPTFAGCFADPQTGRAGTGYTHDAQCVVYHGPDQDYAGRQICFNANETALSIADVTDKQNTVAITRVAYPNVGYTHQGWLSEDQRYFFLDDELDEIAGTVERTRTLVWDVTDLDDPQLVREFLGETSATDHNLYVRGDLMYQSNYVSGLRIIDVSDPLNPHEIAFFDTVPYGENSPGFGGSWSNYPFFPSGNIILTSGYEGLFVVRMANPQPVSQ
ncbi:MAG: choice-of-anchor B family protein, partial [Longimicrobiales bacterium]